MADFEQLLKAALEARVQRTPQALSDLNTVASELNRAVEATSQGRMRVFLATRRAGIGVRSGMTLLLRLKDTGEERTLSIFETSEVGDGYPMQMWRSAEAFDRNQLDGFVVLDSFKSLRGMIERLIAAPDAPLVRLIANELAIAEEAEREPALAS
jgi:hypothetical protein